jgi:hypothetical protein
VKIIFLLKAGMVEWEVPEAMQPTFNFNAMATQVQMSGYFMAETLYLRHSELVGIAVAGEKPVLRPLSPGETLQ